MTRRRFAAALLAACLALGLGGCAGAGRPSLPGQEWVRSELFFGRSKPNGSTVTEEQWKAFVDQQVTPRFPDGLTIVEASGQWRDRSGTVIREASRIVLILHAADEKSRVAIQEIRALYRKLFDQESVLLISSTARVDF